jgi:hypothetical protein
MSVGVKPGRSSTPVSLGDVLPLPLALAVIGVVLVVVGPAFGPILRPPTLRLVVFSIVGPLIIVTVAALVVAKYFILLRYSGGGPPPPTPLASALITALGACLLTWLTVVVFPTQSIYDIMQALGF